MRKWLMLLFVLALASGSSAAISGRLTLTGILAQAVVFGGIFGPMYLFPERYADWGARCRLAGFRRRR